MAVMSMIEGDGDADMCGNEDVGDVAVAGDRDGPLDVNEDWGMRLVCKSSNGHQSNVVVGSPGVVGGPNKNIVVSCLATAGAVATTHLMQMRIGRAALPKYIVHGGRDDDEVGSEVPRFDGECG
jgi:hypothetical protein